MAGEEQRRSSRVSLNLAIQESKKLMIKDAEPKNVKCVCRKKIKKVPVNPTPLPENELLELAITILQSKDRHGYFAEPVDPELVEFYYETIPEPMDFGTIKSKIRGAEYKYLEEFEYDVNLVWRNAMEFNEESTVYFKMALALEDLATKVMHQLKAEPQLLERRFRRLLSKSKKRQQELASVESDDAKRQKQYAIPSVTPQLARRALYVDSLEPTIHPNNKGKGILHEEPKRIFGNGGFWVPQEDLLLQVTKSQTSGQAKYNLGPYANHLELVNVNKWMHNPAPKAVVHPSRVVVPRFNSASTSVPWWDPSPMWPHQTLDDFYYRPQFEVDCSQLPGVDNQVIECMRNEPAPASQESRSVENPEVGQGRDQAGASGGTWGGYGSAEMELLWPDDLVCIFSMPPPPL